MLGQVKDNAGSLTRFYYLKDHLPSKIICMSGWRKALIGDIKVALNQSGGVDSYNDYYPFGMQMPGRNLAGTADGRFKFTGKEQDVESSLDYFGARYYDSWRGQWLSVDPMAKKYSGWGPYNYCEDNPLALIDAHGDSTSWNWQFGLNGTINLFAKVTSQQSLNFMTNALDATSAGLAFAGTGFGGLAICDPEPVTKAAFAGLSGDAFLWSGVTGFLSDVGSAAMASKYHQGDLNIAFAKGGLDLFLTATGAAAEKRLGKVAEITRWGARSAKTGRWVTTAMGNEVQAAKLVAGGAEFFMARLLDSPSLTPPPSYSTGYVNTAIDMTSTATEFK